jgi:hypothetical protein
VSGAARGRRAAISIALVAAVAGATAGYTAAREDASSSGERATASLTRNVRFTLSCRVAIPTRTAACRGTWRATGGISDSGRVNLESTDNTEGGYLRGTLRGRRGTINLSSNELGYTHRRRGCPASTTFYVSRGTRAYATLAGSSEGSCSTVRFSRGGMTRRDVFRIRLTGVPAPPPLPAPRLGRTANTRVVRGRVRIRKGRRFVPLSSNRQIPVGSELDTRRGTVRMTTATADGKSQTGDFGGGVFQVRQARRGSDRGVTESRMKGGSFSRSCSTRRASASQRRRRSRKVVRRLRTNARGRYRTRGRYSAATVRGTVYTVEDRCDGTVTTVRRGSVVVRDFKRRRNVTVTQGKSYRARP